MEAPLWAESSRRALRLGLSACLGIALGEWWRGLSWAWISLHGGSLVGAIIWGMLLRWSPPPMAYPMRYLPGILCWISLTAGLAALQSPVPSDHHASLGSDWMLVQITRQDGPARFRAIVYRRILKTTAEEKCRGQAAFGNILLSFPGPRMPSVRSGQCPLPGVGEHLLTEAHHLQPLKGPQHPGQADLRDYYHSQGIYHEINLSRSGSYRMIPQDSCSADGNSMGDYSYKARFGRWQACWSGRMDKSIKDSVGLALSKALLLGWRVDLSQELQDGFRNSGTVHLLAVSGLHVLFIYQILDGIMRGLYLITAAISSAYRRRLEPPKYLIFIVLSSLILAYALLTGGAPSAMRAAMMVVWMNWTRIISGNRHASAALLLTGILLIILEPLAWKDPGFQLSFGAVGGLLWIYAPLRKIAPMEQSPKIIRYAASLLGMSLVAQAVTAPLCWYHFGQFPNYFLAANLVLVPLSSPLLITAIAWTLLGNMPGIGPLVVCCGEFLYGITALCTSMIGKWPGAVSYYWDFRGSDLAFSIILLGILIIGLHRIVSLSKTRARAIMFRRLIMILGIVWIIMIAYRNARWYCEGRAAYCFVFGISPGNCLWIRDGSGWLGSGDPEGLTDRRPLQWMRRQCQRPVHTIASGGTDSSCRLLQWKVPLTLVAGLKDTFRLAPTRSGPLRLLHLYGNKGFVISGKVDIVVLGQRSRIDWPDAFMPSHLILTGGQSRTYRRHLASRCLQQGIVFCDLSQSILPDSRVILPHSPPNRTK